MLSAHDSMFPLVYAVGFPHFFSGEECDVAGMEAMKAPDERKRGARKACLVGKEQDLFHVGGEGVGFKSGVLLAAVVSDVSGTGSDEISLPCLLCIPTIATMAVLFLFSLTPQMCSFG